MALGLLTVHLAGLIVFAYTCFGVGSGTLAFHIGAGLIAVILVVFAHTMSYFYLVAMTSMMRKALAGESGPPVLVDDPRGPELLARSRRLKSSAVVWAMGGMTLPDGRLHPGGGAHTRAFPAVIHTAAGYLGLRVRRHGDADDRPRPPPPEPHRRGLPGGRRDVERSGNGGAGPG